MEFQQDREAPRGQQLPDAALPLIEDTSSRENGLHDQDPDWSWVDQVSLPKQHANEEYAMQSGETIYSDKTERLSNEDSDSGELVHASSSHIRLLAHRLSLTCGKLASMREDTMQLRERGAFERDQCSHLRKFFIQSQQKLAERLLKPDSTVSLGAGKGDGLKELQLRLYNDQESVEAQEQMVLNIEVELMDKEQQLKEKEEALAQLSNKLLAALGKYDAFTSPREGLLSPQIMTMTSYQSGTTRPPSPEVPELLKDFYDKRGAVGWNTERLLDLQGEYGDALADRQFKMDHEQTLEISDEDFEYDYKVRISLAQQALDKAIVEADKAKAACDAEGIDTAGRQQPDDEEASSHSIIHDESPHDFAIDSTSPGPGYEPIPSARDQPSELMFTVPWRQNHDAASAKMDMEETQSSDVRGWMQSNENMEQYPFDQENFQEFPERRPTAPSRRSIGGPLEDLDDWPEIEDEIKAHLSEQLKEHSQSEPNIFSKKGATEQIRAPRSSSESRVEELRRRQATPNGTGITFNFGMAKTSGVG